MSDLQTNIEKELARIEEDSEYSAKSHFNAASRWNRYHLVLGLAATVIIAIGGVISLSNYPIIGGSLAIICSSITATLTFLSPSDKAKAHKSSGDQYLVLRNKARLCREITMKTNVSSDVIEKKVFELAERRDQLNQESPNIPRKDYKQTESDIAEGRNKYAIDAETT